MFQQELKKPPQKSTDHKEGEQKTAHEQPFKWNHYQARYDEKKKMQHHTATVPADIELPIGTVNIVSSKEAVPEGWRKLTYEEGKQYKEELGQLLGHWSIVGFQVGGLDGHGYGCQLRDKCGEQCGEVFIVKPKTGQSSNK